MAPFVASTAARPPAGRLARPIRREDPIDADAYELFRRGSELLAARHAHQAVIALERARDAAPGHGSVHEALGRAYYGAGRPAAAGAEFAKAIEIDPSNDYAHFGLGLCLARGGERTLALGHLRLAVAMRPGNAAYRRALSRVEHQVAAARPRTAEGEGATPAGPGGGQATAGGPDAGVAGGPRGGVAGGPGAGEAGPAAPDPDPPGGRG
jgi:tetratricopeptide (TPR) repeat protein